MELEFGEGPSVPPFVKLISWFQSHDNWPA